MSQTLQWRMDRVKQLLRKLHPSADIPDQQIRYNIHMSRNDVVRRYMAVRENLFRTSADIADQALLPVDWFRYADSAYYANGGTNYPVEYVPVEKVPIMNNSTFSAGYPESPKFQISDRKINTAPAGLTLHISYYKRLADLWNSANTIPLSTTDIMPQETEYAIVRGALERCVRMTSGLEVARQLIERNEMDSQQAALEWYGQEFQRQVKSVQPFI